MPAIMDVSDNTDQNGFNGNGTIANNSKTSDSQVYFIDKQKTYEPLAPSADSNLIELYGLSEISKSVARSNPDGSKGVKLRKSYKNHISDLPGKHVIPKERNLSYIAFQPREQMQPVDIKPLDETYLRQCLNFDKTNGAIPGFEVAKLGMIDDDTATTTATTNTNKKRKADDAAYNSAKKKLKNV